MSPMDRHPHRTLSVNDPSRERSGSSSCSGAAGAALLRARRSALVTHAPRYTPHRRAIARAYEPRSGA